MPVDKFGEAIPPAIGAIIMWSGSLGNIPAGWVLCDGNNGTPNLLDRFVKGIPNGSTEPGSTGGANSITLSESQLPSHTHSVSSVDSVGDHKHTWGWAGNRLDNIIGSNNGRTRTGTGYQMTQGGSHSHSLSTSTIGSGSSVENRPPYYEVAFLMKT